jgi:tetratricopeptide (TPR) repeat protein
MIRRRGVWWIAAACVAGALAAAAAWVSLPPREPAAPRFVGGRACIDCHREQYDQWRGSHHDRAMELPGPATVVGDFNDAAFSDGDITSRFSTSEAGGETKYSIHTQGPDGKIAKFPVSYTFGFEPLQQYLIDLPGGRKQALTIAWDAKNHRWFSLYPGRQFEPDDWLHWTQRGQSWNSNCAECHSTNLQKNYDLKSDTYRTTWSDLNVNCEACHGPGSRHVEWATASHLKRWWSGHGEHDKGLLLTLRDPHRAWGFDAQARPALIGESDRDPSVQVEMCAQCHARRGPVSAEFRHGDSFLDHYMPQLLQENIYHPDGQILDEVYEYGSFLQSKMYHHGVRCTDCHNPHSGRLIAMGNALCVRCHLPAKYDAPQHHFHPPGTAGTSCIECHMPSRTYMVVDPRRDHSLRIPRPDLSVKLGTPNACNQCHTDQSAQWAADTVREWYGPDRPDDPHYGPIFAAAWSGDRQAGDGLRKLLVDEKRPAFIRASAASSLQGYGSPETMQAASGTLADGSPLVRAMSAVLLGALPPPQRVERLGPLLNDPVRAVRHIAARSLLSARDSLTNDQRQLLEGVLGDQASAMVAHSDNVAGRMALGGLYQDLGRLEDALAAYKAAVAMDRQNLDAHMALAELYIRMGRDREAETVLTQMLGLARPPELPQAMWDRARGTVQYQLGLLIASDPQRRDEAVGHLLQAADLIPTVARLYYNLGELQRTLNRPGEAEKSYLKAHDLEPADADVAQALVSLYAQQGRWPQAESWARRLVEQFPGDPGPVRLLDSIRAQRGLRP